MPAIVRVKRRVDEEPLSAFLLNGKKRRIEDGGEEAAEIDNVVVDNKETKEEISTKLKFVGTINEQNDTMQIMRLTKDAAKDMVQQKTSNRNAVNHTERARNEMRQAAHEQRFRVVNCMRTTINDEPANINVNAASKEVTIVDIEKEKAKKVDSPMAAKKTDTEAIPTATETVIATIVPTDRPSDSDTGYVYDLYMPENEQLVDDVDLMDDYLSVRPINELVYEDYYRDEDESDYESEDSNQENYYTNDYPDEYDECTFSESDERFVEEIATAIAGFVLDNNDLEAEEDSYVECSTDDDDDDDNDDELNINVEYYYDSVSDAEGDIIVHVSDKDTDDEHVDERFHSASENGDDETKN